MKSLDAPFRTVCMLLTVYIFLFFNSDIWARPRAFLEAWLMEPGAPVAIGETKLIPVHVSVAPKWQSAFIQFEVDTRFPELPEGVNHASVQSEKFEIDASLKAPFTVYVPVKVTGEGLFQMKGILHFDMPEGKTTINGLSSWDYKLQDIGIFSFDGEVFFGGDIEKATSRKVDRNLLKENSDISKLLQKEQFIQKQKNALERENLSKEEVLSIKKVLSEEMLSEEEEKKLKEARSKEYKKLRTLYSIRYPKRSKLELPSKVLPQPLNQGDSVTLEVNWPIDISYTSFLPLDKAQITLTDNQNSTSLPVGELVNGKYTFTVPRDNYSFTAKVTASYGNSFSVNDGSRY